MCCLLLPRALRRPRANENFSKQVEDLQKLYEGYTKDKEEKMAKLKDGGLGLMKSVKASRKGASKDEL